MEAIGRLMLRVLLVPFGALVAILAAASTLIVANRAALITIANSDPQQAAYFVYALPLLIFGLGLSSILMMLPAVIGMLVAEAFALRSVIYHALNGGLSAWVGWSAISDMREDYAFLNDPKIIVAAGLAAGFGYWLVAGWSAGFWKPVFRRDPELATAVKP